MNRVDAKHIRPSVAGTKLVTEAIYVGLEQEGVGNGARNSFAKVEDVISGYDGAGQCIAMADKWLPIVCKVNVEATAILNLGNPLAVRNALTQANTAWDIALANHRSDLMRANKDTLRSRLASDRSKGRRHGFFSGFEHYIQHGSNGLAMLWFTKGRDVLETEDVSSGVQLAAKHRGLSVVRLLLPSLGPGCSTALEWVQGKKLPTGLSEPPRCLRP